MDYKKIPVDDTVMKNPLLKEFLKGKHQYLIRNCITVDPIFNKIDVDLSNVESYFSNPIEIHEYDINAQLKSEGAEEGTLQCGSILYTGENTKVIKITLEYGGRLFIKGTLSLLYLDPYNKITALGIWLIQKK